MTKKIITKLADDNIRWDIDGCTLQRVKEKFEAFIAEHGEEATLDISLGYDDTVEISIFTHTEETDQEYQERLEREKLQQTSQRERDMAELKRLQEKYGV